MSLELTILKADNVDEKRKIVIYDKLNELKCNYSLLNKYINIIQHNSKRIRSSHYKNISGLVGSTRKIRPQKRMGKSRQGSIREIHMRGGAVKFGFSGNKNSDLQRKYRTYLRINKKEKLLGQKIVLFNKLEHNLLTVVEKTCNIKKTRDYINIFHHNIGDNYLYIYKKSNMCNLALRNIKNVKTVNINTCNIVDLLSKTKVVFDLCSFKQILNKLHINYEIN